VCQYWIRSANGRDARLAVVQEMAGESPLLPDGKLTHVLDLEGEDDLDAVSTANGMVTRLRATIEVRYSNRLSSLRVGMRQIVTAHSEHPILPQGSSISDFNKGLTVPYLLCATSCVQGHVFLLGDYIVRIGGCRKGAVFRGLCLEVRASAILRP